ncbi:MAG TPA: zinc ribbon domain-containing protein [Oligoflexia bacterium]|nr:zinc ribbon domain-containing protein [Oligoflexia bacterium]HMR25739.1 zinc ribbon domain-containing protein [Oligoflexia bacterium]
MKAKNCACCFMPLKQDLKESGSDIYCSYCYVDGRLLAEGMTLKEFKEKAYQGMLLKNMNKYKAKFFSWMIGFAPYWKTRQ